MSSAVRTLAGRASHCACLAASAMLIGCVAGVVPLPTHTKGATGEETKQNVRPDFIRPGQTTRAEVTQKLAWANSGLEGDYFFLARWSQSKYASFALACGYISCMGGGQRHWGTYNALVEFDDQGVVKQSTTFGDSSLDKELSLILVREKPADFSEPQKIWVDHYWRSNPHAAAIILSKGNFEVQETGKKGHNFKISSKNVVRLEYRSLVGGAELQHTRHVIYFAQKTEAGAQMSIGISLKDLMLLHQFLAQDERSDLR